MSAVASPGTCALCGGEFAKNRIAKHVVACPRRKPGGGRWLHLSVQGGYASQYWMHLEASPHATLQDLDFVLRRIWLECCGHMSEFEIEGRQYLFKTYERGQRTMKATLGEVLRPGLRFTHTYDFGTSTELVLRVVAEREGGHRAGDVHLLARNAAPPFACGGCGSLATDVCAQCSEGGGGWLCKPCGRRHECGDEMLLPVVNSPRVGQCGYTG